MDYIETRKQIEARLIKKAKEDKKFETLLFSNPSEALKQIGISLPGEFELNVIQEKKGQLILVYPEETANGELSELELLNAVGGCSVSGQVG